MSSTLVEKGIVGGLAILLGLFITGLITVFMSLMIFIWAYFGSLVLRDFWNWFIIPVFVGLKPITLIQAYGLMLVASFFKIGVAGPDHKDKNGEVKASTVLCGTYLVLGITYLVGWIVKHYFMGA